jgi:hypothetical protein
MTDKQESTISAALAMIVLFVAILDPKISVILSIVSLVVYAVYKHYSSIKAK